MKPGEVIDLGQKLKDAIELDAEKVAAETAIELLLGVAFNIALIAHTPEPIVIS